MVKFLVFELFDLIIDIAALFKFKGRVRNKIGDWLTDRAFNLLKLWSYYIKFKVALITVIGTITKAIFLTAYSLFSAFFKTR
jgi:hypothetical protein